MRDDDEHTDSEDEPSVLTTYSLDIFAGEILSYTPLTREVDTSPDSKQADLEAPTKNGKPSYGRLATILCKDYGDEDVWNPRAGVRELIQNLWDGAATEYGYTTFEIEADEITSKRAYSPIIFNVYPISLPVAKRTGEEGRYGEEGRLAWIKFTPHKDPTKTKLELVNHGVSLPRKIFGLGGSTKRGVEGAIGGHGEGLKTGSYSNNNHTYPHMFAFADIDT